MQNKFNSIIDNLTARGLKEVQGDYYIDNILYCHKCNTPKSCEITIFDSNRVVSCLCKCEIERREEEKKEIRQKEFKRTVARNKNIGFPESEMQEWTFANDDCKNLKITNAMHKYVDNFNELSKNGKGLLLYGDVGTGKTYYAACIANALIENGYTALMTNFSRVTNTIQGLFEGKQEYLDSLNRFSLLILDDLGIERDTGYMKEQVFNIIDSRYRTGKPMIVTTNLSLAQMTNCDDIDRKRIYDRIIERCHPIEVKGESRRIVGARQEFKDMNNLLGL